MRACVRVCVRARKVESADPLYFEALGFRL